jgi:hypothetical protein
MKIEIYSSIQILYKIYIKSIFNYNINYIKYNKVENTKNNFITFFIHIV